MKKIIILLIILICGYYFWIKFISIQRNNHEKVTENIEKMRITESPKWYLVNVLEKEDYDDAHIKGSINVPLLELDSFLKKIDADKAVPLIFYCTNYYCTSSDVAAQKAAKKGFEKVYVYRGGIAEWYQANKVDQKYEIEGPCEMSYLQFVIIPEKDLIDSSIDIIDEDAVEENQKINIISINDLQKILKEDTL